MAPVILAFRHLAAEFRLTLISTAQHRQMLDQVLNLFDLTPDLDLDVMRPNQGLADLTARVLEQMTKALQELQPDLLVIQGDTTTVLAAALASFYQKVPVAHVEAGLRSYDIHHPFPEEINRLLASVLTTIHLAPTVSARDNLRREGVESGRVVVTGNTVVDALLSLRDMPFDREALERSLGSKGQRLVLVTSHRRESWGHDLEEICWALRDLVVAFPDIHLIYPVHLNPNVRQPVHTILGGVERVSLSAPLDYLSFINLMQASYLILTDSGGIQEEAPTFQVPVLVLRQVTERPEAVQAGLAALVGTNRQDIVAAASRLLSDAVAYRRMQQGPNPFGDGRAVERIVSAIRRWLNGESPLLSDEEEFHPPSLARTADD